jgi:hypothetical protein
MTKNNPMNSLSQVGGRLRFLGAVLFCAAEILKTPPENLPKTSQELQSGSEQIRTSAERLYHIYRHIAKTEKKAGIMCFTRLFQSIGDSETATENSPSSGRGCPIARQFSLMA